MEKAFGNIEQNTKEDDWEILNDNEQNEYPNGSNYQQPEDWKQQEQHWRSQQISWNQKIEDYKQQEKYWLSQTLYWNQFNNSKP